MFPNGNVGLENSKFYEDVPARGHLIGRAATGSCPKSTLVMPAPAGTICVGESRKRQRSTTHSITGAQIRDLFGISDDNLVFLAPHDYEAEADSYEVEVTADGGAHPACEAQA